MYSASFLGDLDEVVKHIDTRYPKANLYGVGWSMGANILVQYLGKVVMLVSFFVFDKAVFVLIARAMVLFGFAGERCK